MASNIIHPLNNINLSYTGGGGRAKPITNGRFFFGKIDGDPKLDPITVQSKDEAGTVETQTQPIATNNSGHFVDKNGKLIDLFSDQLGYSVLAEDRNGKNIYGPAKMGDQGNVADSHGIYDGYTATSIAKMISGETVGDEVVTHKLGQIWSTDTTKWETVSDSTPVDLGGGLFAKPLNSVSVKANGAIGLLPGLGLADSHAACQWVVDNFDSIHFPNPNGERYGFSQPLVVPTKSGMKISADRPARGNDLMLLNPLSQMESVLQFLDGSATPGANIITLPYLDNISIDANSLSVFGFSCGKFGSTANQLVKFVGTNNLSIIRCRFGYLIGGAGNNIQTDSAGYSNINTVIEKCTDGGFLIETGNGAAINFIGPTINGNGFNPTTDQYNLLGEGFNGKVVGGEVILTGGNSAGAKSTQPLTSDFIASSGSVKFNDHWSDTHGPMLIETGGTKDHSLITGGRHYEGSMNSDVQGISATNPAVVQSDAHDFEIGQRLYMTEIEGDQGSVGGPYVVSSVSTNTVTLNVDGTSWGTVTGGVLTTTPVSISHQCKMVLNGGFYNGKIESIEGISGSITPIGVNFATDGPAKDATKAFIGTLITNQKGLVSINNRGNRAQVAIGGGNRGMSHLGPYTPQTLHVGCSNSETTGPTCISQILGPNEGDSGVTRQLDPSTGKELVYINCYPSDTVGNIAPIKVDKDCHIINVGGGSFEVYTMSRYKFLDSTPVPQSSFITVFNILQGAGDAYINEVVMVPPKLATDPAFVSGDYWEGGFYYNTTTNKHRANTGGSTWVDMY